MQYSHYEHYLLPLDLTLQGQSIIYQHFVALKVLPVFLSFHLAFEHCCKERQRQPYFPESVI